MTCLVLACTTGASSTTDGGADSSGSAVTDDVRDAVHASMDATSDVGADRDPSEEDAGAPLDGVDTHSPVLGTVAELGDCALSSQREAQGFVCATVEVGCPGLPDLAVDLMIMPPSVQQRGVAVLGSGTGGTSYYNADVMQQLAAAGFRVVNRKWHDDWVAGPIGMRDSACRYATLVTWIRAQDWSVGPLCVTGNSGGSA
ncbi:MAG: hypothetical protein QF464_05490, partial [Myxococcota bacterium]|nr:hypothetical protein [Myxococcota bacterium]